MRRAVLLALAATVACSSKSERAPHEGTETGSADPGASTKIVKGSDAQAHVADDAQAAPPPTATHPVHPIDVTLRSTPSGARAIVDGTFIGTTPTFWSGEADGHEHEFTFELPQHALARYRFVPIVSGVVHARLEPLAEEADGGVPQEMAPSPIVTPNVVPAPAPIAPPPAASDAASSGDARVSAPIPVGPQP